MGAGPENGKHQNKVYSNGDDLIPHVSHVIPCFFLFNGILMVHHHVSHEHDVSGVASPWGNPNVLQCLCAEKVTPKMISKEASEGTTVDL